MTNVLYLDIECAPIRVDSWGLFNQNFGLSQIREDPRILCFAAKWRGEKAIMFSSEWEDGREAMLHTAYELLGVADVVGHFNGQRFDVPWLNGEFARMGWGPPAPYQQLDFLRVIKSKFRFPSNKLQYVSEALGIGGKVAHEGHGLWVKCMQGDPKARKLMEKYNKQDVTLLQDLHDRLMPWITGGPNARLTDGEVCDRVGCGGTELRKEGFRYTAVGMFQRFTCKKCGGWSTATTRTSGTGIRGLA